MDRILMALGELTAERRHRKEEEGFVEVSMDVYRLRWLTGNRLQVVYSPFMPFVIAELPVKEYGGFGPALATAIQGIIEGHQWSLEDKED